MQATLSCRLMREPKSGGGGSARPQLVRNSSGSCFIILIFGACALGHPSPMAEPGDRNSRSGRSQRSLRTPLPCGQCFKTHLADREVKTPVTIATTASHRTPAAAQDQHDETLAQRREGCWGLVQGGKKYLRISIRKQLHVREANPESWALAQGEAPRPTYWIQDCRALQECTA